MLDTSLGRQQVWQFLCSAAWVILGYALQSIPSCRGGGDDHHSGGWGRRCRRRPNLERNPRAENEDATVTVPTTTTTTTAPPTNMVNNNNNASTSNHHRRTSSSRDSDHRLGYAGACTLLCGLLLEILRTTTALSWFEPTTCPCPLNVWNLVVTVNGVSAALVVLVLYQTCWSPPPSAHRDPCAEDPTVCDEEENDDDESTKLDNVATTTIATTTTVMTGRREGD